MGIEDRDWYREKKIDWDRGGLKKRNGNRPYPKYIWWILAAALLIVAAALFRPI